MARFEGESGGGPTTPADESTGLGSSAFARRYLRNLFDFFSSGYLDVSVHPVPSSWTMYSSMGDEVLPRRVPPFGNPRITVLVQLPWAFRRLRVLLRQLVPRHSSMTLFSLITRSFIECSMPCYRCIRSLFGFQRSFGPPTRLLSLGCSTRPSQIAPVGSRLPARSLRLSTRLAVCWRRRYDTRLFSRLSTGLGRKS